MLFFGGNKCSIYSFRKKKPFRSVTSYNFSFGLQYFIELIQDSNSWKQGIQKCRRQNAQTRKRIDGPWSNFVVLKINSIKIFTTCNLISFHDFLNQFIANFSYFIILGSKVFFLEFQIVWLKNDDLNIWCFGRYNK